VESINRRRILAGAIIKHDIERFLDGMLGAECWVLLSRQQQQPMSG